MKHPSSVFLAVLAVVSLFGLTSTAPVAAQPAPLNYSQLVAEAHRIERLEGSEYVISNAVLFKRARLDLKPVGEGSDAFYVVKRDEIGFVCAPALKSFRGGWVEGRIERHEAGGDGGHFFTLSDCQRVK